MNVRSEPAALGETDYRLVAEAIPHIVWVAQSDGSKQYLNRWGAAYTGLTREANYGWHWVSLVHPEDVDRARQAWGRATRAQTPFELEYRIRRADGEFRWHAFRGVPMHGTDGQLVGWIGTATDIDDQKQLETNLRRAQRESAEALALLETLYSKSPVGLGFIDRDFRIVRLNKSLASVNNTPMQQQIGRTVADVVPKLWPQLEAIYRGVCETRQAVLNREIVGEVPSRPGQTRHWLANYHPVIVEEDVIGVGVVVVDITERKRAEESQRAADEQFKSFVDQSIAGIYIIQDGRLSYVNERFAQIFGYARPAEVVGLDFLGLVAQCDRAQAAENLRLELEGFVKSVNYSFRGLRKDGSTAEVGLHESVSRYLGRPAVIGLLQDISDKKRAEEEIRRYVAQLESALMRTVEVARKLSELRDPYTAGHERRVAEIAAAIGKELGFDAGRVEGLRIAGYLHDIGKITVPAEILAKPTRLNAVEYELIKGHPRAAFDVLKDVDFPWPVALVALQHHERLDGSGYPQGLKADEILLEARITAVADVVEAMSSHRPYRPGLGIDTALAEIERGRGVLYDAAIVDVCLKLFREKGYTLPA